MKLLRVYVILMLGITLLPMLALVWVSVLNQTYVSFPPADGYTLRWYMELPEQNELFGGLTYSLVIAISAAVITTVVGTAAAWAVSRSNSSLLQSLASGYVNLPLIIPNLVLSLGLYVVYLQVISAFGDIRADRSGVLLLSHVVITLPWAFRLTLAGLMQSSGDLENASLTLGRNQLQTFFRVTLPLMRGSVVSAAMFCFIFSFSNIEISLFLVSPGQTTLPVAMMQYVATILDPTIAAMAVVQMVITVGLLLLASRLSRIDRVFGGGVKQ